MNISFKRALVLAPHTDDGEFGCGGTISKLIASGCEVHYAAFSACQQSVLPQFPADILPTPGFTAPMPPALMKVLPTGLRRLKLWECSRDTVLEM